jgi:hypothetical protein
VFFSEIAASLYPWDLADQGVERVLDVLQEATGCDSAYLIALMHHEKRPLTDFFYPHNPVRKTYCPEDSRAYFRPDPSFYGRITPRTSDRQFLKDTDWLRVLIDAARARGMRTGVELSHTLVDAERASDEFPDCVQRDIYGNRLGKLLCPNNGDAREYVAGLFCDLAHNYDVDYVQTCLIPFADGLQARHSASQVLGAAAGGCFCEACKTAAQGMGVDWEAAVAALRRLADSARHPSLQQAHERGLLEASNTSETAVLLENPALFEWLSFRRDAVTGFYADLHTRVHAVRDDVDLRLNAYITSHQELQGLDLRALRPHLDSIRSSDYSEQSGAPARLEHKRQWLLSVRRAIGEEMHFVSGIGVRPRATPELVRQGVVVSAECGADGITIGHYDGAPLRNLRAVREGMALADVELLPSVGRSQP